MQELYDTKEYQQVIHYLQIGRFEQAQTTLLPLLGREPNNSNLLYYMAWCCYGLDKYDEALNYCGEALANGFSVEDCHSLYARIFLETKHYKEAEESLLESLRINPQNAALLARYGYLMLVTGHHAKAKSLIAEALRLEPDNSEVLNFNFRYFLAKNKKLEQIEVLQQYLITGNNEVTKLINLGLADLYSNDYKSARENFRQAFLLDPTNKELLSLLEDISEEAHILYLPQRAIAKSGGPAVAWVVMIILLISFNALKLERLSVIVAIFWIVLCIYSYVTPLIYKKLIK